MARFVRGLSYVLTCLLILVAAAPALAQSSAAEDAKRRGDDAMVALRYEEAVKEYRTAYEATSNPALLYNMGRAYEGLADFPRALEALEQFAAKAPPELKARVPRLEELLRDVQSRVATLVVLAPVEGAEIRLGPRVVGKTVAGALTLKVNAGRQRIVVQKEGYFPFEKEIPLAGGTTENVDTKLKARANAGILHVTSPVTGAAVAVDGEAIGIVPAETTAAPGPHRVALTRDGYETTETNVVVAAGERKDVNVPMARSASILGKWWFWTAVGVVVAAGVTSAVALTTERSPDTGTIAPGQVKAELRF